MLSVVFEVNMNWDTFQTHNEAREKAFEILCNQLFENWCLSEYKTNFHSFYVVNGAGGDGGVESYVELKDGKIVGLQAKWFLNSIGTSQIQQIKNSIETALKIRPNIVRYIVCVPRDLASKTAKGKKTEQDRWDDLVAKISEKHPNLKLELWSDYYLTCEIQKPSSVGIERYWFSNSTIPEELCQLAFRKSKDSWLKLKYVPDLNTFGDVESAVSLFLGDYRQRADLNKRASQAIDLCEKFELAVDQLIELIRAECPTLVTELNETAVKVNNLAVKTLVIKKWSEVESSQISPIEIKNDEIYFQKVLKPLKECTLSKRCYFHISDVEKLINKLSAVDFGTLFDDFNKAINTLPLLIKGEPGTGKTHGVAAISEKLLSESLHTPLLVQARDIAQHSTWKEIIEKALGLSSGKSEDELWQALTSMVNRHRFTPRNIANSCQITPKFLVIVDALDESEPIKKWLERMGEAKVISESYPHIRFCFTSRPHVIPYSASQERCEVYLGSTGDAPVHKLFNAYMKAFDVKVNNQEWLKYALKTPLSLKLFCELNQHNKVDFSSELDVSLVGLVRKKIQLIEKEYCERVGELEENQLILRSITVIAENFLNEAKIESKKLSRNLENKLNVDSKTVQEVLTYLKRYGILSSLRKHGDGLTPDEYFYIPGIQGYFDYAMAHLLLSQYEHPKDIIFKEDSATEMEALYTLAAIAMQKYDYLLTDNKSIRSVISARDFEDLLFFGLRHSSHKNAHLFKDRLLKYMSRSADCLIRTTNGLILPLARDTAHPLGTLMLDEYLLSFKTPAERDLYWSLPVLYGQYSQYKWNVSQYVGLAYVMGI